MRPRSMRESTGTPARLARCSISSSTGSAASHSRTGAGRLQRQVLRNDHQVGGHERGVLRAGQPQRGVERRLRDGRPDEREQDAAVRARRGLVSRRGGRASRSASRERGGRSPSAARRGRPRCARPRPGSLRSSRSGSDSREAAQAGVRLRLADQDVGGAALGGHARGGVDEVVALLDQQVRAEHGCQPAQRLELLALLAARRRCPAASRRAGRARRRAAGPSARRAARAAASAARGVISASTRSATACGASSTSSSSRVPSSSPAGRRALRLDLLGRLAQHHLAQRGQVLDPEEVVQRGRHALGRVDLAGAQPRDQRLRASGRPAPPRRRSRAPGRGRSRARARRSARRRGR